MAKNMSLESMLDEERKDVLALLEGNPGLRNRGSASSAVSGRAPSPYTPRSPVRSMLDIGEDTALKPSPLGAPNGRANGNGNGRVSTQTMRTGSVRSMLDIDSPPPAAATTVSASTSPTQSHHRAQLANTQHHQHRSLSDAASRPAEFGPRSNVLGATKPNPNPAYQFSGYLPSNPGGPVVPKRNTQGGKKVTIPNAMAEVVRGGDISSVFGTRDSGRHHSIAGTGIGTSKSRSPHNRLGARSNSPHLDPSKFVTNDGRTIDMNNAYRRLSDANLARSGGGLSSLSGKGKGRRRTNSGEIDPLNGGRLEKDYTHLDGDDALADSSDEEHSSDEERTRGRRKTIKNRSGGNDEDHPESKTVGMGRAKGPRTALSLMAAAEEERLEIAARNSDGYRVRSLLDPEITITGPSGAKLKSTKPGVHPNTSFDEASGFNTPVDSDTEADITDIKRAQKLTINMTPIVSTPATSRCVRTIYRGDFAKMQQEAQDNMRRVRKYLCATDLSDEAAHALEWTIGTVIRDGDTLLAVYCVDEEVGISEGTSGDDAQMKEQAAAVAASARPSISTPIMNAVPQPSPLSSGFRLDSTSSNTSASPMGRERGKTEQERYRAVQDITDRVSKLLRKTKLQVKVVIEVIHCKSPKHLITEIIDYITPTLVILGSRGRNALKGVILGSFSNYLVTKSSVPVMVARKKLRKHAKSKYKPPTNLRLANNLTNTTNQVRTLDRARID